MSGEAPSADLVCGVGQLYPQAELRPPEVVMRLERMGSFFPSRLSFMRSLLRDLATANATVERGVFDVDDDGFGRAVYTVRVHDHSYSLCAFSNALEPEQRTDRVIAEAWDSSFVLYDGVPSTLELDRLNDAAPRQEAARYRPTDIVLSRANRSVRLFEHVVERLAAGHQPDADTIGSIGYLMRTTAVYGNGKFGIADRALVQDRPILGGAFRAEMLAVWLIRAFTHDLVEHVAHRRSPATAVGLDSELKRHLGIGNSTGLGMAPFLVSHPELLNNWMLARETALARVRAVRSATAHHAQRFRSLIDRAQKHAAQWNVEDDRQQSRIVQLRLELGELQEVAAACMNDDDPWDRLVNACSNWSAECEELVVSALLETYPELVDGLAGCMVAGESRRIDPAMTAGELRETIETQWAWAVSTDFDAPENCRRFWYTSEEKLEPRLGDRFTEEGAELERPLDIARRVCALHAELLGRSAGDPVATLCKELPQHRFAIQRVQTLLRHPYAEIRDNLIAEDLLPIDMLRCKLSFFGAAKFDPKSDRWTRVTLFQGAPLIDELGATGTSAADFDDWWLPVL